MSAPTKLGKYEIKRELGKGAMGIVYEGFDPFIERIVAIKTILKSQLDSAEAQDMLNRFRREAQAAGRLAHPNIVGIFEYGEDEDVAFIAMEFIKGNELKKLFDEEARFKLPDAVRIMTQLLDALNYSHERGVVHRDIKPANIIITESGQVKVADFGIARIESSHLTQAGTVLGTPTHMSPEQFMGLTVDRRSDIYSAGVILYQFLTGERPFTGSVVTIMHKVLNQEPIAPSALNFSVSKSMDEVVRTALAKKPEDRFQTAAEFSTALTAAANDLSDSGGADADATFVGGAADPNATMAAGSTQTIQTTPAKPGALKPGPTKPVLKTAAPVEEEQAEKKKSPMMAIVIVVVVLAVGGVGAWFALRPTSPAVAPQAAAPSAPLTIEQQAEAARLKREKAKAEFEQSVKEEEQKLAEVKKEREGIALATEAQAKAEQEQKAAEENERKILAKLQQDRKQAEAELAKDKENAEKAKLDLVKAEQLRVAKEKEAQQKMASAQTAASREKAKQEQEKLVKEREKAEKAKLELAKAEQARVEKEKTLVAKREQDLARDLAKAKADKEAAVSKAAAAKVATDKARADADVAEKKRKVEAEAEAKRKVAADAADAIAAKNRVAEDADAKRKAAAAEAADAEAKRKAAEAEKKTVVASIAPSAPAAVAAPSGGGGGTDLFAQGQKYDSEGNAAEALKAYTRAANAGYGPAMKKLGDIYGKGNSVVPRDYAASIQWYNKAKQAGADVSKDAIKR